MHNENYIRTARKYGEVVGVWENPDEYVGKIVYDVHMPAKRGIIESKSPYITTKKVIRNDKPCWTVCFTDGARMWYDRSAIEKLITAAKSASV